MLLNMSRMLSLVIFFVALTGSLAMYAGTDVVELTPSNFQKEVMKSDNVWIIEFYGNCTK